MEMTLKDRLAEAMAGPPKISQAALARACKVSQPSVNDWLSGKTKTIKGPTLLRVARFLRVSPDWLATGKGARIYHAEGQHDVKHRVSESGYGSQNDNLDALILSTAEQWVRFEEGTGRKFQPVRRLERIMEIVQLIQADGGALLPASTERLIEQARQGEKNGWRDDEAGG